MNFIISDKSTCSWAPNILNNNTKHRGRTASITASYTEERGFKSRPGERLHEVVRGTTYSLQDNFITVPEIRERPLPSTSFPLTIRYLSQYFALHCVRC
jgi:hypothetical protein